MSRRRSIAGLALGMLALAAAAAAVLREPPVVSKTGGEPPRETDALATPTLAAGREAPARPAGSDAPATEARPAPEPRGASDPVEVFDPFRHVKIKGTVEDATTGSPVVGARVTGDGQFHRRSFALETDRAGWFEGFVSLSAGSPEEDPELLSIRHPGFLPKEVVVAVGETGQPLHIALERGVRIRGRVLDENGQPADGVAVHLLGPVDGSETAIARAETAEGRFDLGPVEPGAATAIVAPAQRLELSWTGGARVDGIDGSRSRDDVVLRLRTAVAFEITAVERDGTENLGVDQVLSRDECGAWVAGSLRVAGTAGVPCPIVVLARRDGDAGVEHLRGEAVAYASEAEALDARRRNRSIPVSVTLLPTATPPPAGEPTSGVYRVGRAQDPRELHRWILRLVDATSGLPASRGIVIVEWAGRSARGTTRVLRPPDGAIALSLDVGTWVVRLRCAEYLPRTLRLDATALGETTRVVRLQRAR